MSGRSPTRPGPGRRSSCARWCRGRCGPAPRRCGPRPAPGPAGRGGRTRGTPSAGRPCRTTGRWAGRGSGQDERSGAGAAARRGAAPLAGQGRGVAGARGLHEDRPRGQAGPDRLEGRPGQPRAHRAVLGRDHLGAGPLAQQAPVRDELVGPPRAQQHRGLGRAGEAADEHRRALRLGPQAEHLAHVRVGRPGSACRSSPSSQMTTRPRSWTGAKAADRVPTTTRRAPRETDRKAR